MKPASAYKFEYRIAKAVEVHNLRIKVEELKKRLSTDKASK